jgi:hypothetical protein
MYFVISGTIGLYSKIPVKVGDNLELSDALGFDYFLLR